MVSALSASSTPNLEQLKSEAVALEGNKKHEEALAKYEEVLVIATGRRKEATPMCQ
jgi:hypothetical protein